MDWAPVNPSIDAVVLKLLMTLSKYKLNNDDLSLQKPEKVFALNEITRLEKAVEKHFSVFYKSAYSQHERDRKIIFFFCMNHTNVLFSSFCRPSFSRKNLLLFLGYYKVIEKLDTFFPVQRKS